MCGFFDDNDPKRNLGIRDKQILYRTANKKCQNPTCSKDIEFDEMQVGHKIAWSKGGRSTLKNSVSLCYRCNKLQGTDSWATFLKKQGVTDTKSDLKNKLDTLTISQLKLLAKEKHIKVKGKVEEGLFFGSSTKAPTKKQYINKLSGIVKDDELNSLPQEKPKAKKKKRKTNDSWF